VGSASIYRRRLQRIGHGSYLITLSRDWVEAHGLKKGSEIIIMDDGPSLRMFPADTLGQRTVQLQLKEREDPRELSIPLWTYYMQGADEVVVKSDGIISSDVKHSLRSLLLEMPGAFIVDEDAYTIRVKVSSDVVKLPTDGEVRKMVGFTIKVYEDSARAFMEAMAAWPARSWRGAPASTDGTGRSYARYRSGPGIRRSRWPAG
jgi:Phosphate uptake regulator